VALAVAAFTIPQQPAARACHSAASTPTGIVVWGGARACGVGVVDDGAVWKWDGKTWSSSPGPAMVPREDALLVSDGTPAGLTLIGGRRDGRVQADVWQHSGSAWKQAAVTGGPGAIEHGAAAFDPKRKRVVVFGGAVGRARSSKTWEWTGDRWIEFDVPGPAPRVGHGMAWSEADGGVLLYGGFAANQFRDLWRWDGRQWTQLTGQGPTFSEGHVVAEAPTGIYVVGPGLADSTAGRLWQWRAGAFHEVGASGPRLTIGATATFDRARGGLLYWGGSNATGAPSSAPHEFDGARWRAVGSVGASATR